MTNITKYLPENSPVVEKIYAWHKRVGDSEPSRGYLGASIIGNPCARYLWYNFRDCCKEDISGRIYRLWETGDLAEPRFVKELRGIGCEVHEVDGNGNQFAVEAHGGHFSGHLDAAILGVPGAEKTWHVGEFKTHKGTSFNKLKKVGVLESKPVHYAQMQVYMGLTGMKRALYLAVNKDTDELWADRIHFDRECFDGFMAKAKRIIEAKEPPPRLSERPDWYECKWCPAQALCHGGVEIGTAESALPIPSVSCRQCCHATPIMDGNAAWRCERHGKGLCQADQKRACDDHLILPGLMYGCEPNEHGSDDAGSMWIEFVKEDGELWRHGRGKGEFSTEEIRKLPLSMLSESSFVKQVKDVFGARIENVSPDDILSRYPEEDVEIAWTGATHDLLEAFRNEFGVDPWEPIAIFRGIDYEVAEFSNGGDEAAVVIKWLKTGNAEIRIGKM